MSHVCTVQHLPVCIDPNGEYVPRLKDTKINRILITNHRFVITKVDCISLHVCSRHTGFCFVGRKLNSRKMAIVRVRDIEVAIRKKGWAAKLVLTHPPVTEILVML